MHDERQFESLCSDLCNGRQGVTRKLASTTPVDVGPFYICTPHSFQLESVAASRQELVFQAQIVSTRKYYKSLLLLNNQCQSTTHPDSLQVASHNCFYPPQHNFQHIMRLFNITATLMAFAFGLAMAECEVGWRLCTPIILSSSHSDMCSVQKQQCGELPRPSR